MKSTISVALDKGLINQLEELSKAEDRSVSSILRLAGREYLARFNKPAGAQKVTKDKRGAR